jgi:hypothetical protein
MSEWVGYLFAEALVSKPWLTRCDEGRETAHNEDQAPRGRAPAKSARAASTPGKKEHLITLFRLIP